MTAPTHASKAVVYREGNASVAVEEIRVRGPHRGEVMVRMAACGVCHSDLSATNGTIPIPPPVVLGHEGAGVVAEVGEGVTGFAKGDHVVSIFVSMCGKCRWCVTGRPALCDQSAKAFATLPDGSVPTSDASGAPLNVFSGCGVMSELATLHKDSLVKIDADGGVHGVPVPQQAIEEPRLSPDGRKLALGIRAATNDIWVYDFARSTLTRVTFDADNFAAVWTPDAARLTFSSNRAGPCQIYWRPADGAGPDERIVGSDYDLVPGPWSRDGDVLIFTEYHPETGASIWMCSPLKGTAPRPLLRSRFNEYSPALSPDNHWLAYTSDESGRAEVYVVSFPTLDRKVQISIDGGAEAIWARDGRRLYYRRGSSIMSVDIGDGPELVASSAQQRCEGPYLSGAMTGLPNYDVTAEGDFLMIRQDAEQARPAQLSVIVNWFADLSRQFA